MTGFFFFFKQFDHCIQVTKKDEDKRLSWLVRCNLYIWTLRIGTKLKIPGLGLPYPSEWAKILPLTIKNDGTIQVKKSFPRVTHAIQYICIDNKIIQDCKKVIRFFFLFRIYSINVLLCTLASRQKHISYFLFHFPNQWASDLDLGKHLTVQNAFVKLHQWPTISNRVMEFCFNGTI